MSHIQRSEFSQSPLRCGVAVTGAHEPGHSREAALDLLELARTAEAHGFSDVWIGDHIAGGDHPWFASGHLAAALAVHCQSIGLGWIVIAPLRTPAILADELATIDALANGRLSACVVGGWRRVEYDLVGASFEGRTTAAAATLDEIAGIWSGSNGSAPVRALRPVHNLDWWFGGSSRRAAGLAAKLGVGFLISSHVDSTAGRALVDEYRAAWTHMHAPRVGAIRQAYVDSDDQRAWEAARPALGEYYDTYRAWGLGTREGLSSARESSENERLIVGSPSSVTQRLQRLRDDLDLSMLVLRVGWPALPAAHAARAVALLGDEVVPALADRAVEQ